MIRNLFKAITIVFRPTVQGILLSVSLLVLSTLACPIQDLAEETSLLMCIGYARQLEAAQSLDVLTGVPVETRD